MLVVIACISRNGVEFRSEEACFSRAEERGRGRGQEGDGREKENSRGGKRKRPGTRPGPA